MLPILVALATGLLFGAGLAVSQMVDPAKVLGFLDFGGIAANSWDPTLALVMGGALAVTVCAFAWARRRGAPLLVANYDLPKQSRVDGTLLAGALLFGLGWGLVGYCPGPAIAGLAYGSVKTVIFVAAMLAGMLLHQFLVGRRG